MNDLHEKVPATRALGSWGVGRASARLTVIAGALALALVATFVTYSLVAKDWCEAKQLGWDGGAWGKMGYGGEPGECTVRKSWFSF